MGKTKNEIINKAPNICNNYIYVSIIIICTYNNSVNLKYIVGVKLLHRDNDLSWNNLNIQFREIR